MKWHPDKNKSDEAKEKFQEISEAYSILTAQRKRKFIDQVGIDMTKNGGEAPMDPSDIFKHFMSSMGGWEVIPFREYINVDMEFRFWRTYRHKNLTRKSFWP